MSCERCLQMPEAPDLVAAIAAVREAAAHTGLYGNCLESVRSDLRHAQRVLEALADHKFVAAEIEKAGDSCLGRGLGVSAACDVMARKLRAALLARAGGGG